LFGTPDGKRPLGRPTRKLWTFTEIEIGRACGTRGIEGNVEIFFGTPDGKIPLGRPTRKQWNFTEIYVSLWAGFLLLKTVTAAGSY
jgi:hypothetical protein